MKEHENLFRCPTDRGQVSSWVVGLFPERFDQMTYIEPFVGGGAVFSASKSFEDVIRPGRLKVINDPSLGVTRIWQAVRDECSDFITKLNQIVFNEKSFDEALSKADTKNYRDYLDHAVNDMVLREMSEGGDKVRFIQRDKEMKAARMRWENKAGRILGAGEAVCDARVFNLPASDIIKSFDASNTLVYCDPPKFDPDLPPKSVEGGRMGEAKHVELANILSRCKSKVVLVGGHSQLYDRIYKKWRRIERPHDESVAAWVNYP